MAAGDTCAGDTPSRRRAVWLSPGLLLLLVQGCFCLSGPSTVRGTEGGSLSVQCRYDEENRTRAKFWCSHRCWPGREIVRTKPPEVEARNGRVSIRDHPANLTFTVTLENLSSEDEGRYLCGVGEPWVMDVISRVTVLVFPAPTTALSYVGSTVPVMTLPAHTGEKPPDPSPHPRCQAPAAHAQGRPSLPALSNTTPTPPSGSLLGSVHGLLLVFLKLPLLLAMLAAVLWVNRPQRGPGRGQVS